MSAIYTVVHNLLESREKLVLARIIKCSGSTPRGVGAMCVVTQKNLFGTIGGGQMEYAVEKQARKVLEKGESLVYSFRLDSQDVAASGMICGGGAGYVSQSLAKLAKMVGVHITVIDDREKFASTERFPDADRCIVSDFEHVFECLDISSQDYIVILTRGASA